jgi:hypothetical protein
MDFKKILEASKQAMVLGIGLVAVDFMLQTASVFIINDMVAMASGAYSLILVPAFFLLYAWAGYTAVTRHGMDLAGGGLAAAFAYLMTSILSFILSMIGIMLMWGRIGMSAFSPAGNALFGSAMAGATGVMAAMCMLGVIALGVIINFVVGAGGAAIADMTAPKARKKKK